MKRYLKHQAEGIYHMVILTRHWISEKGGIYVRENEKYKLITPSHFVAKLTEYIQKNKSYRLPYKIKIAVINSENPLHIPDSFEKEAVLKLQNPKIKSYWKMVKDENGIVFRYTAPLKFKSECTNCHYNYSEKTRGCISISFPAENAYMNLQTEKVYMALFSIASISIVFAFIYFLINHFVLNPLKKFALASAEIEKGNLNVRVNISSNDEWGKFAKQFNNMIEKVAQHRKELEEKIKVATAELQKAYEDLKKTEKFKSEFFSNVTHDLKTPITAIKGAAELMLRKDTENPYVLIIQKNVEKLSRMIDDILECTKLENGQLELKKEENNLVELIEDVIFALTPLALEKKVNIRFVNEVGDKIISSFDRDRIYRAISNIVVNAVKFSPHNADVILRLKKEDSKVLICVEDFGPGIPEAKWDEVFRKFYKGNTSYDGGMGLGLAIAKGIIEAHNGKIWISQPEHRGIAFNIMLPLERWKKPRFL